MRDHHASCSCGQLTLVARGDPIRVAMCHCLACQRRTGSTYGAQARFATANVEVRGRSTVWVRTGDEGTQMHFHFCPDCGATVSYAISEAPDVIAVPIGAFADPSFPPPLFSVWETRKHPWVNVPTSVEHQLD